MDKETVELQAIEVKVYGTFEDAMRRFRSLVQKEKIIGDFKQAQRYEKPSEKKRRLRRESRERQFLLNLREEQIKNGEWDRRQKMKEAKKTAKIAKKYGTSEY